MGKTIIKLELFLTENQTRELYEFLNALKHSRRIDHRYTPEALQELITTLACYLDNESGD